MSSPPYDTLNLGVATADADRNVAENRSRFLQALDVPVESAVSAQLSHGNRVSVFQRSQPDRFPLKRVPARDDPRRSETIFDSDAVISDVPGLHFLLTFADCVPILFVDRRRGAVGAAHAGWRGTAAGIAPAVVHAMQSAFETEPEDLAVGIGPSIGPCCYEVGADVLERFRRHGHESVLVQNGGKPRLDLWASNEQQLRRCGVRAIENLRLCTSCRVETFFSHRAEGGATGRGAVCIGLGAWAAR